MSHQLLRGSVYHKRYHPKSHDFTYRFFMLDIDVNELSTLKSRYFSLNKFNLFGFYAKDHFGTSNDFYKNIQELLATHNYEAESMRFVTLPRMIGFVFNPISILILQRDQKPYAMLVEVHNYDGGRIVYPVELTEHKNNHFHGSTQKDMHVSPFFERDGHYDFILNTNYNESNHNKFWVHITYTKDKTKKLTATLNTKTKPLNDKELLKVFFLYPLLTLGVVVQTIWQSLRLRLKGLTWYDPLPIDQQRRS